MHTRTGAVRALLASRAVGPLASPAADMIEAALRGAPFGTPRTIHDDLRKAIAAATGVRPERTLIDAPGDRFARIVYSVDYDASLAWRVRERHWPRLEARFAATRAVTKDDVWSAILMDAAPHGLSAWDDPFAGPRNTPGENLLTTLFYFASSAALGDGEGMEPLANLVRLLPRAVPIGERPAGSGDWLVAMRPATR